MPTVVADAGPLHYLVLIGDIELLPKLFGTISLPELVHEELMHPRAPAIIREWLATAPTWLKPLPTSFLKELPFPELGRGERAAIALAASLHADLVLMDDRAGATAARDKSLTVIGTLGILDLAARRGLINLPASFDRPRQTNFRCKPSLMNDLLAHYDSAGGTPP